MSASPFDPDIQAAFSNAPAPKSKVDPDIAAAFTEEPEAETLDPKEQIRRGLPKFDNTLTRAILDIPGGIAHGVGTLVDVGRNVVRTVEGEPTIPYGSPESTAAALSAPFSHPSEPDQPSQDPKEAIRRSLPKLGDQGPAGQTIVKDVLSPAADIGQAALSAVPFLKGAKVSPPAIVDTSARQSIGAAATTADLSATSPELQAAHEAAKAAGEVNEEALQRHVRAETLPLPEGEAPLRLRKGQATQDAQQISDEKNMRADPDTQGILTDSINEQNRKLVDSLGEIRRRATPDIVQRNNLEHGQSVVDSIKTLDNAAVTDIRAKYKALADANGGAIPLDTGATIGDIDTKLRAGYLTGTAAKNSVVSEIMDDLRSGQPMSFESFENARSRLAEVQRAGGSDSAAAGIVHDALENMPLPPAAAPLKELADTARSAARARFNIIRQNPAYQAAIEDNVPKAKGLHVLGAPSPLADTFMDRYFLGNGTNASRTYIARMKNLMGGDPSFSQSIEAAALNKLRTSAGVDENGMGGFNADSFRNARNAMQPKADVLMSPQSLEHTQQLSEVARDVNSEPKGSSTNRSNTALTLQRFGAQAAKGSSVMGNLAGKGTDLAIGTHLGPVALGAKKVGEALFAERAATKAAQALKAAKLKFAEDAVSPGAGIAKE